MKFPPRQMEFHDCSWRLSSDELGQIDRLAPLGASS
jgi:hypothetical protein